MELKSIGTNIRKYRKQKGIHQEQLAYMTGLSANYIGMIERGEKLPALDTFLRIADALEVSADMLLADALKQGYKIKESLLAQKLNELQPDEREKIYAVIDAMVKYLPDLRL